MQVAKWGNSLAVRLPKKLVEHMGLKEGDEIELLPAGENRCEIAKSERRQRALKALEASQWRLPKGYKFDRDQANEG